jgi:hypothetical protein
LRCREWPEGSPRNEVKPKTETFFPWKYKIENKK